MWNREVKWVAQKHTEENDIWAVIGILVSEDPSPILTHYTSTMKIYPILAFVVQCYK